MSDFQELEVKILNVDVDNIKEKLKDIQASFKKEVLQKIYTYDCYSPITMYKLAYEEYEKNKTKNSLMKLANIYLQIEPVVREDEKKMLKAICGYDSIKEYVINCNEIKESILTDEYIMNLLEEVEKRFFKWVRLRQNGEKIELTIKYIYSTSEEYAIDDVKEIEINVDNFEVANMIVEELGYFRKKLVEKKRISYRYNNVNIEIDEWPLIKPYIEIEADSEEEIYDVVKKLGYSKKDTQIMNTDDVYLRNGLDLTSYEVLTFSEQKKFIYIT